MNYERPELLERLASAYVLGTMGPHARARFARLLTESTMAQRAVADWNKRLSPLAAVVPPQTPPDAIWQAIAAKTTPVKPLVATAPKRSWWSGLLEGWGRPALAFGLGAVLATTVVLNNAHQFGMHHMNAALPASYVGILTDEHGDAVLTAGSHRRGETMMVKVLKPFSIPAGKVARLWALHKDGQQVAIANVPASGSMMVHLDAPAEDVFFTVPRLAVSFESDAAASTPAAPFVLSGNCVKFW